MCSSGAVRVAGGSTSLAGIVEVCINTRWGRICEDNWNSVATSVVCHQLGFQNGTMYNNKICVYFLLSLVLCMQAQL